MESTGEILEKYIRRKISQVELSKLIGVSPQYISNIINDLKGPSENFLNKFYIIFDVTDEDKKKISEYEELRKLPKKISLILPINILGITMWLSIRKKENVPMWRR